MNKLTVLTIGLFLFITAQLSSQSWSTGSIKGEGEVVKQEITLPAIDGISLEFSGDVVLTPGSTQKIVIEGQQNIIDNIRREVRDGTWRISFDKNVKDAKPVIVYMTLPTIEDVVLSGSGSIRSTGKFSNLNDLEIAVSGSGDISLEIDAQETDLAISGSGGVKLSGSAKTLEIAISGSGDVNAADLVTSGCEISISGSGDAQVKVNGDLETAISGSGDVHYSGNASVKAKISGSGSVSKL